VKVNLCKGDSYAVHTGTYAGEILIFIKAEKESLCFLAIPNMENREIPKLVFENARNKDIIKFVDKVPSYIVNVSTQQYKINEKSPNRREQLRPSNILDSEKRSIK
jgi:hypothetical protein